MAIKVQLAAPSKVYYPRNRRLMWFISGILIVSATWALLDKSPWIFPVLLLFQGSFCVWASLTTRLVISPGGIAFDSLGVYSVVTSWSNVEQVADIPSSSGGTIRALILREPTATGWWYQDAALLAEHRGRVIPLSGSVWGQLCLWEGIDKLEQDIQHYAPHALS